MLSLQTLAAEQTTNGHDNVNQVQIKSLDKLCVELADQQTTRRRLAVWAVYATAETIAFACKDALRLIIF